MNTYDTVDLIVGSVDGENVGTLVGDSVGSVDGENVGTLVGDDVGRVGK